MKYFESFLSLHLEDFLAYRLNLGYCKQTQLDHLKWFDRYLKKAKPEPGPLSPDFFLELRSNLKLTPSTVNRIICTVRAFFNFMIRKEYYDENPVRDIPFLQEHAIAPFIFSFKQTDRLLKAVYTMIRKDESFYLNDLAIYMAILLLARCGMRISEPLRLHLDHYRPEEKSLYIENTKFSKDRLIPVPAAVAVEIDNFLNVRNSLLGELPNPYLLPGIKQRRLTDQKVRFAFHQAVKDIGLACSMQLIGNTVFSSPTPHSLRHSYAVNTLKRIKLRGKSPQQALPVLAAYMGHTHYRSTSNYLKFIDARQRQGLVYFVASHKQPL
jgi:site-specific recombinase XerD